MPKRSHLVLKMAEGPRPFRNPLCTWTPGMATFEGTRSPKCCPWTNQGHLTFQHTPPWPRPSPWDAYTRAYTNRGDPARLIRERPLSLGGAADICGRLMRRRAPKSFTVMDGPVKMDGKELSSYSC